MYKLDNKLPAENLKNMFALTSEIHSRNTRGVAQELYDVIKCKLETGKRNFRYSGAVNWNSLPLKVRHAPSLSVFKKECLDD